MGLVWMGVCFFLFRVGLFFWAFGWVECVFGGLWIADVGCLVTIMFLCHFALFYGWVSVLKALDLELLYYLVEITFGCDYLRNTRRIIQDCALLLV